MRERNPMIKNLMEIVSDYFNDNTWMSHFMSSYSKTFNLTDLTEKDLRYKKLNFQLEYQ